MTVFEVLIVELNRSDTPINELRCDSLVWEQLSYNIISLWSRLSAQALFRQTTL